MSKKSVRFSDTITVQKFLLAPMERHEKREHSRKLMSIVRRRMTLKRKALTKEQHLARAKRKLDILTKVRQLNNK